MPSEHQKSGHSAELIAQKHLESMGYRCLEKQWHSRYGEIDLIMEDGNELVFVEVKSRTSTSFGLPEEMVSRGKAERLSKTAFEYLEKHASDLFWRFDTIAITFQGKHYEIFHLKDTIRDDRL